MAIDTPPATPAIAAEQPAKKSRTYADYKARRIAGARSRAAEKRREFARIAADMEMGYHVDEAGVQWPAAPFTIKRVIEVMGYHERRARPSNHPDWWPGTDKIRKMVAYTVAVRRMQSEIDLTSQNAWAGPLIGLAVEEMNRRLAETPEEISDRDLTELITKLTRLFVKADGSTATTPAPLPPGGKRFTAIYETVDALPEGPARENARRIYEAAIVEARAAIGAGRPA